jgi:threonine aldolase
VSDKGVGNRPQPDAVSITQASEYGTVYSREELAAIVVFNPSLVEPLSYRLRRAGQTWSKMRFAAAQLIAYVEDGLFLRLAAHANDQPCDAFPRQRRHRARIQRSIKRKRHPKVPQFADIAGGRCRV